jgi:hypothetical protein
MRLPPAVHFELLVIRGTIVDAFTQREQVELIAHNAKSFDELRGKFAYSIYLVQPDDTEDYMINTDASAKAIEAFLIHKDKDGRINIVSTASRVLTPAEQRYTACELELMAIVYAFRKFRVYFYGHKITLNTDHKSLIFFKKCVVTSNRVDR